MRRILPAISFLILAFIFAGCGVGGSSSSQDSTPVQMSSSGSPSGSASGSVTLTNSALHLNETTSVSATFKKTDGTPASGINVNFSTSLGTITPAGGIVVTDASGTATVQLTVGATSGQGQITASATVDNNQISKTGLFSVSLPPLKLSPITLGLSTLSYGGSTSVSVTVTDANGVTFSGQEVDVTFTSTQTASGKATIASSIRTVNGIATVTYQAITATGSDTITATIAGDSKTATITVNPLNAGSISFVSASPTTIGLKGMGGAGIQETSVITFKVVDTSGVPNANQPITFSLNTKIGGISMLGSEPFGSGNSVTSSTGQDGTAFVVVQSGTIATPIRVTASTDIKDTKTGNVTTISTQSDQLVVSTGVPAQDGFSISMSKFNTESWAFDGETSTITARLSDHFHNPVPDGTAVYFTTSGGSIQSSCVTTGGACSVTWTSQAPRPSKGRVVILAYAVGEEAFLDLNGNGLADAGEYSDTSEAFRDDNESSSRAANETFIDFNGDGIFNVPDGNYNGVLQGAAYAKPTVSKSKHVFSNVVHVMGTSAVGGLTASPTVLDAGTFLQPSTKSVTFTLEDVNGNAMPVGTTVDITSTFSGPLTMVPSLFVSAYIVPDSTNKGGTAFTRSIQNTSSYTSSADYVFTVTTPKGIANSIPITFTWTGLDLAVEPIATSFSTTDKIGASQTISINGGKPPFTVTNTMSVDILASLGTTGSRYVVNLALKRDAILAVPPAAAIQKTATITVKDAAGASADIIVTYF